MTNELIKSEYYMGFEINIYAEDADYEDTGFYSEITINGDKLIDYDSTIIYLTEDDALKAAQDYIEEIY